MSKPDCCEDLDKITSLLYNLYRTFVLYRKEGIVISISTNTHLIKDRQRKISGNWKHWIAQKDLKTCEPCGTMHGKVFPMRQLLAIRPPLHPFCRCVIRPMEAITAGYVTQDGTAGADYWVKHFQKLPENYVNKAEARKRGWKAKKGNLDLVLPGKVIGGDRYYNDDGHLPDIPGREWYEADIDFTGGFRGEYRLLYSNDSLVFASYDHYATFIEIT